MMTREILGSVVLILMLTSSCTKNPKDYPNLKIKDLSVGKGEKVGAYDTVYLHYTGKFSNGKVFDKTDRNKEPRRYYLQSRTLIEGWQIGVPGMKEGGTRRLTIPPELAFGEQGKFGSIPPNATLVFDIELVKIH